MFNFVRIQCKKIIKAPLKNGIYVAVVLIKETPEALDSIIIGATLRDPKNVSEQEPIRQDDVISFQYVTDHKVRDGSWQVVEFSNAKDIKLPSTFDEKIDEGYVGINILNAGLLTRFLGACTGQYRWFETHDKFYYQSLLNSGNQMPTEFRPDKSGEN